ncbi:unnamed protein product [Candidula unifasciata]|uniref:Ubiquitin-associated protein 1 n=1 Tax=Candidula unifasciata TaxID=100452 RepID=A0A8S3YHG2_9EUPU|nr:unnamed protein product [Candidula unifasciata]
MEDRSYSSTLSRHSLASSNSILDGVPFRIGQSFRPPPKVHPPELSRPSMSRNLNVEYTFETEEAVLAWAQAREVALEQAKKLEEQRKQALAAAEEQVDDKTASKSDTTVDCNTDENGCNVYDVPKSTIASMQNHVSDHNKPLLPPKPAVRKPVSEPGSILKPTPIHSSANSVFRNKGTASTDNKLADAASAFDVSMFESEADPFDNLELQTINDMEELKILLDSSTKSSSDTVSTPAQAGHMQPSLEMEYSSDNLGSSVSEAVYDVASVARVNKWETFSDESQEQDAGSVAEPSEPRGETSSPSVDCSSADRTSRQVIEDGEYVEITSNYKKQTIRFQNHSVSEVTKSSQSGNFTGENGVTTALGGKLPASLANSKLYKPVLPPFVRQGNTVTDCNNVSTNPFIQTSAQGTNPFLPQTAQDAKYTFLQNTAEDGDTFTEASEQDYANGEMLDSQAEAAQSVSASKPSLLPPPPPSNRPTRNRHLVPNHRMWSSVGPSLAASLDESVSSSDPIPSNSYSRHSVSSSDLHSSNSCSDLGELNQHSPVLQKQMSSQPSLQSWNRHRPLPPIPSPNITASNPNLESYKVVHLPPSQSVGLTDPYYNLSAEAQAFTNSLTSMGFLRARVARAVAKFGQDEKEVLDHLIAVDMLVEKKYAPVIVESALCTFKNDVEKAEKFLQMLTQFEELGFTREKIQEALITTNMDHDKVLDILTT